MRGKELNKIKIIDLLLRNGKLKMNGESGISILKKFHIDSDAAQNSEHSDSNASEKTIRRHVEELCKDGLLVKDTDGYYSINESYFVSKKSLDDREWKQILNNLLENNELEAYRYIRNYMAGSKKYQILDNNELEKFSERIKESVHILTNNRDVIQKINHALSESLSIRVQYRKREYTIFPVCYVVSRDGTRKYLCSVRRKQLFSPMDLNEVKFLEFLGKKDIDKKFYMKQIQDAWDIDVQPPYRIKILVRKNLKDSNVVIRKIRSYLGKPIEETTDYNIYEGDVIGINDFKTWLRSYIEVCIVLKPDNLKQEFITSLQEKRKRYGGVK